MTQFMLFSGCGGRMLKSLPKIIIKSDRFKEPKLSSFVYIEELYLIDFPVHRYL